MADVSQSIGCATVITIVAMGQMNIQICVTLPDAFLTSSRAQTEGAFLCNGFAMGIMIAVMVPTRRIVLAHPRRKIIRGAMMEPVSNGTTGATMRAFGIAPTVQIKTLKTA